MIGVTEAWAEQARLWLVLDERAARPRSLSCAANEALQGGVGAVVFRHKTGPFAAQLHEAVAVRRLCSDFNVPFILSHELAYAEELRPDAMHVGCGAPDLIKLQAKLPFIRTWGFSAHSVSEAAERISEGYSYCFLGPVFPTPAKLHLGNPLGIEAVAGMREAMPDPPIVWIGGINPANLRQLVEQGARRVAVISAILAHPDPRAAAQDILALMPVS